jgi:hypothetical protein
MWWCRKEMGQITLILLRGCILRRGHQTCILALSIRYLNPKNIPDAQIEVRRVRNDV